MKTFLASVATLTAFAATPALAQENRAVSVDLQGAVPLSCTVVANPSIVNPETVLLDNTSTDQTLGSLNYTCNNAGGFSRTVSSINGGVLKRAGGGAGDNTIAYTFSHGGGSGLDQSNVSLSSPVTENMSSDFRAVQTGAVRVKIGAASGLLYAGNYTDTITITIAPNS